MVDITHKLRLTYQAVGSNPQNSRTIYLNPDGEEGATEIDALRKRIEVLINRVRERDNEISLMRGKTS